MEPLIISFYTVGTPYENEVQRLIASCTEWGLETEIEGVPSQGSWEKNCALKPAFILKKIQQHGRPVLWVDADAVFKQRPDFSDFAACDLAVRLNEFLPKTHASRIVSNTVYVRNTQEGIAVVGEWARRSEEGVAAPGRALEFWDQTALRDALDAAPVRFLPMPLKYAKIFDFDDLFISEKEVVIEHYQASRRHKEKVNKPASNHCCH